MLYHYFPMFLTDWPERNSAGTNQTATRFPVRVYTSYHSEHIWWHTTTVMLICLYFLVKTTIFPLSKNVRPLQYRILDDLRNTLLTFLLPFIDKCDILEPNYRIKGRCTEP